MASFELYGFEDLQDAISRIADIPWEVKTEALDAMAGVAAEKIRSTGESMGVRDPESNTHILDHIVRTKPKQTDSGGYADITFRGTRTRNGITTRNAEIAFVNEYGKRGQRARPFVGQAMTQNENAIQEAGAKIIGDWIENEFSR